MKFKNFFMLCLYLFIFVYGVIVGHYKIFPYNLIKFNKNLFLGYHSKIQNYINFSKNNKCALDINRKYRAKKNPDYSFFIAGHTYGSSGNHLGIYPKFYKELQTHKNFFDFGIFAGDITQRGNKEDWAYFDNQTSNFDFKIFMAPGNHDINSHKNTIKSYNFLQRAKKLYQSIKIKNDLFIILNPMENNYFIKDEQLDFLRNELKMNYDLVDNIVIITHHVIFSNEKFNVKPHIEVKSNFWEEIYPMLKKYTNNYYIVAGDVGIWNNGYQLFCKQFENSVFLATGMGGGGFDNFLIFSKVNDRFFIRPKVF